MKKLSTQNFYILPRHFSIILVILLIFAGFPAFDAQGRQHRQGDEMAAYHENWHFYCIDAFEIASNGVLQAGDVYTCVSPSTRINREENAILFWSTLSMLAGFGNQQHINTIMDQINSQAAGKGLPQISPFVTEMDLKTIIHSKATRMKYPWLDTVTEHAESYMQMGGLLSRGSGVSVGGKSIPAILQGHTQITNPLAAEQGFTLQFDSGGADSDFIRKVPLKFASDETTQSFSAEPPGEWSYQKTDTSIIFTNPNPTPQKLLIVFDTGKTEYGAMGGGFSSVEDAYENGLQLWICTACSGKHKSNGGRFPIETHQRLVFLEVEPTEELYYATLNGERSPSAEEGGVSFRMYRHEEEFQSTYKIRLNKHDNETGRGTEDAIFKLYERFDDKDMVSKERDGAERLYKGGDAYQSYYRDNPVVWKDFRFVSSVITDANGNAEKAVNHGYHYEKTFCDGHPAPRFVRVPDEETDDEGFRLNLAEIKAAKAENQRLAEVWLGCMKACRTHASREFAGVHFHWIMEEVDSAQIKQIQLNGGSEGSLPDCGVTTSAGGSYAYQKSGCHADSVATYQKFISLKYSYTWMEDTARAGYILHDIHPEDIPIEVITTDASENGANASFGGMYSTDIRISDAVPVRTREKTRGTKFKKTMDAAKDKLFTSHISGETVTATDSNAKWKLPASFSGKVRRGKTLFDVRSSKKGEHKLFTRALIAARSSASVGGKVKPGSAEIYSHCNDLDKEGNVFRIYDHRTEGEIHVNKRDLGLQKGEHGDYNSYGDTQGDGILEGARYGLFAAVDLIHPDGKTGVVYKANNLTAVGNTDKNGDLSFLTYTEAPGYTFDYDKEVVSKTTDKWADQMNRPVNGKGWIGRPLLMGDYYIKELSRSEGYELSVENKENSMTNYGQNVNAAIPEADDAGYVSVTKLLYQEGQISEDATGAYGDPSEYELFFHVESKGTGAAGFDMIFDNLPDNVKLYRLDQGTCRRSVTVGSGIFDMVPSGEFAVAEHNFQYPKYNPDGSLKTRKRTADYQTEPFLPGEWNYLNMEKVRAVLGAAENDMSEDEVLAILAKDFTYEDLAFLKGKVERILRSNGKSTPVSSQDVAGYSDIFSEVYDEGIRAGEADSNGYSGVQPDEAAEQTVFGSPVITIRLDKIDSLGDPITVGDAIYKILDFYHTNAFYNYGGVHRIEEEEDRYLVTLYASRRGNPANFFVPGIEAGIKGVIYHRTEYLPDLAEESPRYVYVTYSDHEMAETFGVYENFVSERIGDRTFISARLLTDAVILPDGSIEAKTVTENVYYAIGERPYDAEGNPIENVAFVEQTKTTFQDAAAGNWTELPLSREHGSLTAHINSRYTDAYGAFHNDDRLKTYLFRLMLPKESFTLSRAQLEAAKQNGWGAGAAMEGASYYTFVKQAKVRVYRNAADLILPETGSYVKQVSLVYPGQMHIWQDGEARPGTNTRQKPISVLERVIKQKVKVTKTMDPFSYANINYYGQIHKDWFTSAFGGFDEQGKGAIKMPDFRFKVYLKSNLERLYRDENGEIQWQDRDGNPIDVMKYNQNFPEAVNKIYTRMSHDSSQMQLVTEHNLEKFFDAIAVANKDKWDDAAPAYTSYQPIGNQPSHTKHAIENAKVSDKVRQFAVAWYMKDEIARLSANEIGSVAYADELHDMALSFAIEKARDYLKPFFSYDLDEIYAIKWDSEEGGGSDKDRTTLSVSKEASGYAYNTSVYLPYGVYIQVEQQPRYSHLHDFPNKHYLPDKPKQIEIPTVYDGKYSTRQVPYTVLEPGSLGSGTREVIMGQGKERFYTGYAYSNVQNRFFGSKFRIEKLDAKTHENILHEEAEFTLYAGKRDDSKEGDGSALFYEADTKLFGTKEFLESMGSSDIAVVPKKLSWLDYLTGKKTDRENLYTGIVPAGTPVCEESEQIPWEAGYRDQTVGYVETPVLGAGVYVICERKPPSGYVRSKPVAVELYSDKITYYKEGKPDQRVQAVMYEYPSGDQTAAQREEPQIVKVARINIENEPIQVSVEKMKESSHKTAETTPDKTVTYKVSGRIDGTLAEIGNDASLVYAYSENGTYLGYAWKKGTLEQLAARKAAGEDVQIAYEGMTFSGYGYITRPLATANDENPYAVGAVMTLFDARRLVPSGNTQDHAYQNLVVERNRNNHVIRMYIRGDTDILFYDLSGLSIFTKKTIGDMQVRYGYNRNKQIVPITMLESDQANFMKSDRDISFYALKDGIPYLEFVGGNFTQINYRTFDNIIEVGAGTVVYHLDPDGNRDALVDPYTGMAYILETQPDGGKAVLVWAVTKRNDKMKTSRIATAGENQNGYPDRGVTEADNHSESGYIMGSWQSKAGEKSHRNSEHNGVFAKELLPDFDQYGLPDNYKKSKETYEKGTVQYDRNGDVIWYKDSDHVKAFNLASYRISEKNKFSHRLGEAYLSDNTWLSSEAAPNDPFTRVLTDGQADVLKRVPAGTYIMEELIPPEGMIKGLPTGITVRETTKMQFGKMIDFTTKVEIGKVDGTENHIKNRLNQYSYAQIPGARLALYEARRIYTAGGYQLEKKGNKPVVFHSTNSLASNPEFVTAAWISDTKPIYFEGLPAGDYLLEEEATPSGFVTSAPVEIEVTGSREVQSFVMMDDHTKVEVSKYTVMDSEVVPLKNVEFTLYQAMTNKQGNVIYDDEKPQYDKYRPLDTWLTDDAADFTDTIDPGNYPNGKGKGKTGFGLEFEAMYKQCGTKAGTGIRWAVGRKATRDSTDDSVWIMDDGTRIPVIHHVITYPPGMKQEDMDGFLAAYDANVRKDNTIRWINNRSASYVSHKQSGSSRATNFPSAAEIIYRTERGQDIRIIVYEGTADRQGRNFTFEYQYDYKKLPLINENACSYLTEEGVRRFEYLPVNSSMVLVETSPPKGYDKADDMVITVQNTSEVQHYAVENRTGSLIISKVSGSGTKELAGNLMELYAAAPDGSFGREPEYLFTSWNSGSDGRYTEFDAINNRIPKGYSQGDLKPHTIVGLEDGIYYLAERSSADFYTLLEPIRILYQRAGERNMVRVSNTVIKGELEITKTDVKGTLISANAVFEVSAHLSGSKEPIFTKTVSTVSGKAILGDLPVGKLLGDGQVDPYLYQVKEIQSPDGYALNTVVETFQFQPRLNGISYSLGDTARYSLTLKNEKTRLYLEKRDFTRENDHNAEGIFVPGAEMALFELLGRDGEGNYLYDEEIPFSAWVTQTGGRHLVEGVSAGRDYLLVEQKAPSGYNLMKPVIVTISRDGRGIAGITGQMDVAAVNTIHDVDTKEDIIQSLTIRGRYGRKVEYRIINASGNEIIRWTGTGNGFDLYPSMQLADDELCTITEYTHYSDGGRMMTGKVTRRIRFDENKTFHVEDRRIEKTKLVLAHMGGAIIHEYEPKENLETNTIQNQSGLDGFERRTFYKGANYLLKEQTFYSDGKELQSGKLMFSISMEGGVEGIGVYDKPVRAVISKKDFSTAVELPGAHMVLMDEEGVVLEEWISGTEPHEIIAPLTPEKEYTVIESEAPAGFGYAEEIKFSINKEGSIDRVVMYDKPTHVNIRKENRFGELIGGAALQILSSAGIVLEDFVTVKGEIYELKRNLIAGETYILHEAEAPAGYRKAEDITFAVSRDGSIDTITMTDTEITLIQKPPSRDEGEKIVSGWITTAYGGGQVTPTLEFSAYQNILPKTGDAGQKLFWFVSSLFFLLAFVILKAKRRLRLRATCIFLWILLLCVQLFLLNGMIAYGSEPKERRREISGTAICRDAEGIDEIPETVIVEVKDEQTGNNIEYQCPVTRKEIVREYWENDFQFPIIFHNYPADRYELGSFVISEQEAVQLTPRIKQKLLELLGLAAEDYSIDEIEWDGEAYRSETGERRRAARASGKKRKRDYRLTYTGAVYVSSVPRSETLNDIAIEREEQKKDEALTVRETSEAVRQPAAGNGREVHEIVETAKDNSFEALKKVIIIAIKISVLTMILVTLIWFLTRKKKNKQE